MWKLHNNVAYLVYANEHDLINSGMVEKYPHAIVCCFDGYYNALQFPDFIEYNNHCNNS